MLIWLLTLFHIFEPKSCLDFNAITVRSVFFHDIECVCICYASNHTRSTSLYSTNIYLRNTLIYVTNSHTSICPRD